MAPREVNMGRCADSYNVSHSHIRPALHAPERIYWMLALEGRRGKSPGHKEKSSCRRCINSSGRRIRADESLQPSPTLADKQGNRIVQPDESCRYEIGSPSRRDQKDHHQSDHQHGRNGDDESLSCSTTDMHSPGLAKLVTQAPVRFYSGFHAADSACRKDVQSPIEMTGIQTPTIESSRRIGAFGRRPHGSRATALIGQ